MVVVPAFVVDRLPIRLWRIGNLRFGARLHFCVAQANDHSARSVRTVEWNSRVIGLGRDQVDFDVIPRAKDDD